MYDSFAVIVCPSLDVPWYGSVSSTHGGCYRSEATYTCDPGFEIKYGDMIRTCQENDMWSGYRAFCRPGVLLVYFIVTTLEILEVQTFSEKIRVLVNSCKVSTDIVTIT